MLVVKTRPSFTETQILHVCRGVRFWSNEEIRSDFKKRFRREISLEEFGKILDEHIERVSAQDGATPPHRPA